MRVPGVGRLREAARVRRRERGLARRRPDDVAAAWAAAITDLAVPGLEVTPGAGRLLVLPKTGGTEDAVATLAGRGDVGLGLAVLPRDEVKAAFRALIGAEHARLTDLDYRPGDPAFDDAKARYRALLVPVVARLRDELGLVGMLGANVTYYAERELAGACEEVGLPFLVLHKESIRSPRQREAFTRAYRERTGAFTGRSVAVYNTDERDSQTAGGVVADATVVGCPRIDALHAWREERARAAEEARAASAGPVVLFAIDPGAGTWTPFDRDTGADTGADAGADAQGPRAPRWERLARDTETAFVDLARRFPDHPFVIKAKVGHGDRLRARLPDGVPANVRVITDGTATDLVRRAAVMVAFNSTVVAEGLAAGVPVVVPDFAEAAEPGARDWCYPVGDAVSRVGDPGDLATVVLAAQAAHRSPRTTLTGPASATLERLVGNSDGRAADRTWAWLEAELRR